MNAEMPEGYLDAWTQPLNKSKAELVEMLLNKSNPNSQPSAPIASNSITELNGVYALFELLPDAYAFYNSNDCYVYINKV